MKSADLQVRSPKYACLVGSLVLAAWIGTVPSLQAFESPKPSNIDFKRDIRPILSNRCFACHGPDEGHVESGLRLDTFEGATAEADSGMQAVVPGNAAESELVRRLLTEDEDERMPPEHFGARLSEREVELIQKWIESGAKYAKHWSFDKVQEPRIEGCNLLATYPAWDSAIDRLLLQKLEQRGWHPSPRADKRTLLRRLSLDLTGLPPSLDQIAAFEANTDPNAYEELVDELLASPAFGEHWGRKWLDLARYADSAGYADDPQRTIWGYRDWVIRSLNAGMPFDQFTMEQLAGDLLPDPTDDQLIATAFHRNTLTNNEGGTNDEEFRNVAIVDRVNTTMAVWMGVTMACAQCHSHKYDPISQKEYFQVFAILNQTEDADRTDESPTIPWYTPEQRQQRKAFQTELRQVIEALNGEDSALLPEQMAWEKEMSLPIQWQALQPSSAKAKSNAPVSIDDRGQVHIDTMADSDVYTLQVPVPNDLPASSITGLQVVSLPDPSMPNGGAGIGDGNFVMTQFSANLIVENSAPIRGRYVRIELPGEQRILSLAEVQVFSEEQNVATTGKASQSSTDFGGSAERAIDGKTTGNYTDNSTTHSANSNSPWWELDLGKLSNVDRIVVWNRTDNNLEGRLSGARITMLSEDKETIWESSVTEPKASQSFEIVPSIPIPLSIANADYEQEGFKASQAIDGDGKSGWAVGGAVDASHQWSVAFEPTKWAERAVQQTPESKTSLRVTLKFESNYRKASLARFALKWTVDPRAVQYLRIPSDIAKLLSDPKEQSASTKSLVHRYYVSNVAPIRQPLREQRDRLEKELAQIKPISTVPVMKELLHDKQRETHVQLRGNYKVHGELVSANVPSAFHAWKSNDPNQPMDRLQLAQWLMQPDNPLTARVLANRFWENFFGVGIVRTSEEFGSQGDLPSHPELLDYLALELISKGWDTKRFIRQLVLTSAYQQRSAVSATRYEEDPENVYLSRGPRFRVSAEQVRDMALDAAGLLSRKMHGAPTRPPQPNSGLTAAFGSGTDWEPSKGEDRYRRGLYTQWRRSNPYPSMATFDAPNREVCVLKRDRTNTPLQALVTMNDPAFVEAAQGLARRVVAYELPNATSEERIVRIFELALTRKPTEKEVRVIANLLDESRSELQSDPERAKMLATDPIGPVPDQTTELEIASWTTICNVLLNLDEFLMTP